ncbi:hypothetical protein CJ030_MR5G005020 [Morella rubra]|uniref:SWIM-type domain-containing protein n=1 Tax=Morella rubra TaxID=262757 RepID=A0A6A1VHY1_9ROSI|nr:hypothetical protein CJ030_MR5G005020 [Morella rubra]
MVHLCFHHEGSLNFVCREYVGGEVVDLGWMDIDYISTTVFYEYAKVRLHYLNVVVFVYKFEDDILDNGFSMLCSDKDVWELLNRVAREHPTMLHVYFEHGVDILALCPMESQPTALLTVEGVDIVGDKEGGSISGDIDAHASSINDEAEHHWDNDDDRSDEDGNVEGHIDEPLSDFEVSDTKATPEIYPLPVVDEEKAWFGCAPSTFRANKTDAAHDDSLSEDQQRMSDDLDLNKKIRMVDRLKFRDVKLFKLAFKQYCIQNGFDYKYVKNDKLRVKGKCRGTNCPWRIQASFTIEKGIGWWEFLDTLHTEGLLDTFDLLLPNTEHRFCLKHLHINYKGYGWKSLPLKAELWASETLNAWVMEAREKPLLSMIEIIQRQILNRFRAKREGLKNATFEICPRIQLKLERNKSEGIHYVCRWGDGVEFEVDHHTESRRVVNMHDKSCSCSRWQISGIPWPHVVCAIHYTHQVPEDFVHDYFRIDAYRRAYEPVMHAMPGPEDWPKVMGHDPILPPRVKARTGRPRKVRRRGMDEPPPPGRVTRAGIPIKCGTCGVVG